MNCRRRRALQSHLGKLHTAIFVTLQMITHNALSMRLLAFR